MSNTATKPTPAAKAPATPEKPKKPKVPLTEEQRAARDREKHTKFITLARKRVTKVVKAMRQIENLGRGQYVYTAENADNIMKHLTDAVGRVKVAFAPKVRGSAAAQELLDL